MQNTKIKLSYIYIVTMLGIVCFAEAQTTDANKYSEKEKLAKASEELSKNMNTTNIGYFIENKGQWDTDVLFMANSKSLRVWITKKSMVFEQFQVEEIENSDHRLHEKERIINAHAIALEFSNPQEVDILKSEDISPTPIHFMIGNDPSKHAKNVKSYKDIRLNNIFEGIDIKYYFDEGEVRYDFIIKPYADPNQIIMNIKGATSTEIINNELVMNTSLNPVIQNSLNTYQKDENEVKNEISSSFKLIDDNLSFELGEYDNSKELVIDPLSLLGQRAIGGNGNDKILDIAIHSNGDILFCGETTSTNFPAHIGTYQGLKDVIVGRINSTFAFPQWFAYYGGSQEESANAISVNDDYVYFAGYTESTNYPLQNSLKPTIGGDQDAFLTVLNQSGTTIEYSTFIGGSGNGNDICWDMNVNTNGDVYLVGDNHSNGMLQVNEITTQIHTDVYNGFIMCLQPNTGGTLSYTRLFASLFGGSNYEQIFGVDVDSNENIYITGRTKSDANSFKPTNDAYDKIKNSTSVHSIFTTKLHYGTNNLLIDYNTYFDKGTAGGRGISVVYGDEKIYFGGLTIGDGIELLNEYDDRYNGSGAVFIAAIDPSISGASGLKYSTYIYECNPIPYNNFDLDYDNNCDMLVFTSRCSNTLSNYVGADNNSGFKGTTDAVVGVIDINLINEYTMTDLIYLNKHDLNYNYGNAVKIDGNVIYAGGFVKATGNSSANIWRISADICSDDPCDCTSAKDEWLQVEATKGGGSCDDDQCNISHTLTLPSGMNECFSHYTIESSEMSLGLTPISTPLSTWDVCIDEGETYTITLKLYNGPSDPNPCSITKEVYCKVGHEVEPCTSDCFNEPWVKQPDFLVELQDCPGCFINITYYSRNTCNDWQEIQITEIQKYNNIGVPTINCDACSDAEIYQQAVLAVITNNAMGFYPIAANDPCSDIWRVSKATCWTEWEHFIYDHTNNLIKKITIHKPCNDDCCQRQLRVCRLGENQVEVTDLGALTPPVDCSSTSYTQEVPPGTTLSCTYTCDMLENIDEIYYGKVSIELEEINEMINEINDDNNLNAKLNVSYTNDLLRVLIDESNAAEISIGIYSLNGDLITTLNSDINNGLNTYDIDISEFNTGAYLYAIVLDGIRFKSGKFIINK